MSNPIVRVIGIFCLIAGIAPLIGVLSVADPPPVQSLGAVAAGNTAVSLALVGDTVTLAGFHGGERLSDAQLLSYGRPQSIAITVGTARLWVFAWYADGVCDILWFPLPVGFEPAGRVWLPVVTVGQ